MGFALFGTPLKEEPLTANAPQRIAIPELEKKLAQPEARSRPVVVDVRKTAEIVESGAIPAAVHIPVDEIAGRIGELPKDREIVFYCGGGGRASRAAQAAWDAGYRAVSFCGLRDWKKRGLPTAALKSAKKR
jgi:rhodanese-related sulfurtransferase